MIVAFNLSLLVKMAAHSISKNEAKYEMKDHPGSPDEKLEHVVPGYGHERNERVVADIEGEDNPNVFHSVGIVTETKFDDFGC